MNCFERGIICVHHFFPEIFDVDVDHIREGVIGKVPDVVVKLFPVDDAVGVPHEVLKEGEFFEGELDLLIGEQYLAV